MEWNYITHHSSTQWWSTCFIKLVIKEKCLQLHRVHTLILIAWIKSCKLKMETTLLISVFHHVRQSVCTNMAAIQHCCWDAHQISGSSDNPKPIPDSKVHGANMGPTSVLSAPGGPHGGPINLAIGDVSWLWDFMRAAVNSWRPREASQCEDVILLK